MTLLIAFLGGFCGGLVAHFIWTGGLLAIVEVRMMRMRAAGMEVWRTERARLKQDLEQTKIRLLSLEKRVTGKAARAKK